MPAVSAEFTSCNPSSPIRSKSISSTFNVPTPTLPPSLLKDRLKEKVKEKGGLCREDAEEDKKDREGLAMERILAAIELESGNVEFKKYSRLMNVVHAFLREGGAKAKDAEPISLEDTADKMMDVIFDIKEKITNDEYLSLSNRCRTIYEGGPKSKNAISGTEDGGITICPSNLLNFLEYIANMNVARMLHKEILRVQNQISNLSEEAEKVSGSARKKIETEILNCKSRITNVKDEHSKLMMKGQFYISEMKSIAENDDTLVRLIHSGACNMAYMLMFNSRKRKRN